VSSTLCLSLKIYRCGYEAELLGKYCRRLQAGSIKGVGTAAAGMGPAVAS